VGAGLQAHRASLEAAGNATGRGRRDRRPPVALARGVFDTITLTALYVDGGVVS